MLTRFPFEIILKGERKGAKYVKTVQQFVQKRGKFLCDTHENALQNYTNLRNLAQLDCPEIISAKQLGMR